MSAIFLLLPRYDSAAFSSSVISLAASDINHRSGLAFISAPCQADGMSIFPGGRSIPLGTETTFILLAPEKMGCQKERRTINDIVPTACLQRYRAKCTGQLETTVAHNVEDRNFRAQRKLITRGPR